MALVSFNVLDGADAGRAFCDLSTPVTIGREEGNSVRLNDERVSRFHLKVQEDHGHVVLTDLESTNGTRVNGENVRIALLRPGDQIRVGGSMLVYGSPTEILARIQRAAEEAPSTSAAEPLRATGDFMADTPQRGEAQAQEEYELAESGAPQDSGPSRTAIHLKGVVPPPRERTPAAYDTLWRRPPELPDHLSPAQAAQLTELLSVLHRGLRAVIDSVAMDERDGSIRASLPSWQRILSLQMDLARLMREIAEPNSQEL